MRDNEFTKILGWPGYRVFRHEIAETAKTLRLWVRRKRGNRSKLICSGCGRKFTDAHDYNEREVRDLTWGEYRTTVIIEVYRVYCHPSTGCGSKRCHNCRVKRHLVNVLKKPWGWRAKVRRYDEWPGSSCGICSAGVRRVAKTH